MKLDVMVLLNLKVSDQTVPLILNLKILDKILISKLELPAELEP